MPEKVTDFQVSWKDISQENYRMNKEMQQWEGEHHCIKAKEAWQKSVREYTACVTLEGPGGYLLSLKDHVCAPQKR